MKEKGRKTVTLTQTLLTSKKMCLYICFALTALCDWFLFFSLLYAQVEFLYLLFPMLFGILEVVLFFAILLSGFRFRYSMVIPAVYAVLTIIAVAAVTLLTFTGAGQVAGGGRIMTDAAAGIWAGFHAFAAVAILVSAAYAARRGKTAAVFTGILCVLFGAASAFYAYHLTLYGFFGQGRGDAFYSYETRTVVYEYDEGADCYEAVSVLAGRGGDVVIPEEYNGKKVEKVNYSLFADETVERVRIENAAFAFSGEENFPETLNETLLISCAKTRVDEFRNALYRVGLSRHSEARFELASRIVPIVEEDEVYIAFNYTEDSLRLAGEDALGTWIRPAGTVFRLSQYDDIDYIHHADNASEYDLCWSYNNMDGYIFRTLTDENGDPLEGQPIGHSLTAKAVFGRVYRIRVGEDNDDVYEADESYKNFVFDGTGQDCRYVIAESADGLLAEMPARDGFALSWEYEGNGGREGFTSLASLLAAQAAPVIHPVWRMLPPTITKAGTDATANRTVYGEQVTFLGTADPPAAGFTLTYEWRHGGVSAAPRSSYSIGKVYPADSGEYTFVVKAAAPTISSLVSEAEQSVLLTVTKKTLRFDWTLPQDLVYSGEDKPVSCAPAAADVVSGDELSYMLTQNSVCDAKAYTIGLQLDAPWRDYYEIAENDRQRNFTVTPRSVEIEWDVPAFVYSGEEQCPTATAEGVGKDEGPLAVTVTGGQTHAGSGYTAHASIGNTNYAVSNPQREFSIAQKQIFVTWNGERAVTYDGARHTLTAEVHEAVEGEAVTLAYTGGGTDADTEPYTVTASIPADGNYKFAGDVYSVSETFTIAQREISLVWQADTALTYNGGRQGIAVVSVTDAVAGEQSAIIAGITYSGHGTDYQAGAYIMYATIPREGNYKLAGGGYTTSAEFTIAQRVISFVWQAEREFPYDGGEHEIRVVSVTGAVAGQEAEILGKIAYSGTGRAASDVAYTTTATMTEQTGNYKLADGYSAEETFTIVRAPLTIVWQSDRRLEYSGKEQGLTATVEGIVRGEEDTVRDAVEYTGKAKNAGTHTMRATLSPSITNYTIRTGAECGYEIVKKVVALEWQGRSFVYNGEKQRPTATVTGTVPDETLIPTLSEGETDVGSHTVTATIPENGNYTFAAGYTVTQPYTITAAPLTIAWTGDDEVEYDGKTHTLQAVASGAVHGEDALVQSHVTAVGSFRDAGEHTVRATLGAELKNYAITAGATHTLTITKKQLTITVQGGTKTYDGKPYAGFEYRYTALAEGDEIGEAVRVSYTGEAVTAKDVGSHAVTAVIAAGTKYDNYQIETVGAEIEITAAEVTLTWPQDRAFEADGSAKTFEAEADGILGEDADVHVEYHYYAEGDTETEVEPKEPGKYTVRAELAGEGSGNYTLRDAESSFEITAREDVE